MFAVDNIADLDDADKCFVNTFDAALEAVDPFDLEARPDWPKTSRFVSEMARETT